MARLPEDKDRRKKSTANAEEKTKKLSELPDYPDIDSDFTTSISGTRGAGQGTVRWIRTLFGILFGFMLVGIGWFMLIWSAEPPPEKTATHLPDRVQTGPLPLDTVTAAVETIETSNPAVTRTPVAAFTEPTTPEPSEPQLQSRQTATWSQVDWAIRIEAGNQCILDGMPVFEETSSVAHYDWTMVVPRGLHAVRISNAQSAQMISVEDGFAAYYRLRKAQVSRNESLDLSALLTETRAAYGVFSEPVLVHLWGNYFWQQGEPEAAVRQWNLAVIAEPGFVPAHLNLALAYEKSGDIERAKKELRLAEFFNFQDAYEANVHMRQLRSRFGGNWSDKVVLDLNEYSSGSQLSRELTADETHTIQVLETMRSYATNPVQGVKIMNNIGVYLKYRGHPASAIARFREALKLLARHNELENEKLLVRHLFENMAGAARDEKMPEEVIFSGLSEGLK